MPTQLLLNSAVHDGLFDRLIASGDVLATDSIAVAVSGGSDSVALLKLTQLAMPDSTVCAVSVDHGLRPAAQDELALVAQHCAAWGIPHHILTLDSLTDGPNLQSRARDARYAVITSWAKALGIGCVAIGHTQDDLAETFLMRLARGSGLNGLAAMRDAWDREGIRFVRPMLHLSRGDLRNWLIGQNIAWADDPSNDDPRFDRVRLRQLMPQLVDVGLTADRIADAAHHLRGAKTVVDDAVDRLGSDAVQIDRGDAIIDLKTMEKTQVEVRYRLLARLICWIGNTDYPPRYDAMVRAYQADGKRTLHGVIWNTQSGSLRLCREPGAVAPPAQGRWDGRWTFLVTGADDVTRALGPDGLKQCPDWRSTGLRHDQLIAAPSLWRGGDLLAAPHAGLGSINSLELNLPKGFTDSDVELP